MRVALASLGLVLVSLSTAAAGGLPSLPALPSIPTMPTITAAPARPIVTPPPMPTAAAFLAAARKR